MEPDLSERMCVRVRGAREAAVHVGRNCVVGVAFRDELREAAPTMIAQLQEANIETVRLIGDNEHTVRPVADEVGINDYRAEL
jgi:Cd2+/Zn2+-exporting ATPase